MINRFAARQVDFESRGQKAGPPSYKFACQTLATEESPRPRSFARTHARTHARNASAIEIDFPVRGSFSQRTHTPNLRSSLCGPPQYGRRPTPHWQNRHPHQLEYQADSGGARRTNSRLVGERRGRANRGTAQITSSTAGGKSRDQGARSPADDNIQPSRTP